MNPTLNRLVQLQALVSQAEAADDPGALDEQIDRLRAKLPKDTLRRFDHVASHRRVAVAPLSPSGACGVCHMKLPPAEVLRIRASSHTLPLCPLCGGFLYAAETFCENAALKSEVAS